MNEFLFASPSILWSVKLVAGLSVLLFAFERLSENMQAIFNPWITRVIRQTSSKKGPSLLVGAGLTMAVQRSSVVTLMIVSMINAGVLAFDRAIVLIFGTNIGTALVVALLAVGWMRSIELCYVLFFLAFLLSVFARRFGKERSFRIAHAFFYLGLLWFSSHWISSACNELFLLHGGQTAAPVYLLYAFVFAFLASDLLQSSTAAILFVSGFVISGLIDLNLALVCVLGANLGITLSTLSAALGGGVVAKQTAWIHFLFNLLVVFLGGAILALTGEFWANLPFSAPLQMASFHFAVNGLCAGVLIFYPAVFVKVTQKLVPGPLSKQSKQLLMLGGSREMLPAIAIVQAFEELRQFFSILVRMANQVRSCLVSSEVTPKNTDKIKRYEDIADNIQKEITVFIGLLMEKGLTSSQSRQAQAILRAADEFESLADYLDRLASYKTRSSDVEPWPDDVREQFFDFFDQVWSFVEFACSPLSETVTDGFKASLLDRSEQLRHLSDNLRDKHLDRISQGQLAPLSALSYSDMVVALRKVRAHALNLGEAFWQIRIT